MDQNPYMKDVIGLVTHIRDISPEAAVETFCARTGIEANDYKPIHPHFEDCLAAVDGSNALVAEAGSFSIVAVRSGISSYRKGNRVRRSLSNLRLIRIGSEEVVGEYEILYGDCFKFAPKIPLESEDRAKAAAVLRDTLEYDAAIHELKQLANGDVLLLDGALRVGHASHFPVMKSILQYADMKGIAVGAIAKQTSLTSCGGFPIVQLIDKLATDLGVSAPWHIRIPADHLDQRSQMQWQRGDLFVARLHEKSPCAFKVETPRNAEQESVERIFAACAAYADDGRILGYPYPLLDVHRTVIITEDVVEQIRQDIMKGMNSLGMKQKEYLDLFGDYHDEFNRY